MAGATTLGDLASAIGLRAQEEATIVAEFSESVVRSCIAGSHSEACPLIAKVL